MSDGRGNCTMADRAMSEVYRSIGNRVIAQSLNFLIDVRGNCTIADGRRPTFEINRSIGHRVIALSLNLLSDVRDKSFNRPSEIA
jgi:hypothetical protein